MCNIANRAISSVGNTSLANEHILWTHEYIELLSGPILFTTSNATLWNSVIRTHTLGIRATIIRVDNYRNIYQIYTNTDSVTTLSDTLRVACMNSARFIVIEAP